MNTPMAFLPDANIWLNALNSTAPAHRVCRGWLNQATSAGRVLLLNELTECALLRIATHPRLGIAPREVALEFHQAILDYPFARRVIPGPNHAGILHHLIRALKLEGNDINDAWLAALAIEQGAALVTLDAGFSRFEGLSLITPS